MSLHSLPTLLAPAINAAAGEIEAGRDLPPALVAELRQAGAFRLLTPKELGGSEVSLTTALSIYEQLGRLDASVAWVVWNANFGFIGALLNEQGTARIWGQGSEPVFANS